MNIASSLQILTALEMPSPYLGTRFDLIRPQASEQLVRPDVPSRLKEALYLLMRLGQCLNQKECSR